ncbi:hypothetical protein GGI21_003446, partial [Coemansia aciculifera]
MTTQEGAAFASNNIIIEPEVLTLARPVGQAAQDAATAATDDIAELLERMLSGFETTVGSRSPMLGNLAHDVLAKLRTFVESFSPSTAIPRRQHTREVVTYTYFKGFVLFVMNSLVVVTAAGAPLEHYCLLLPSKGSNDFKPWGSNEQFLLDQALFIQQWNGNLDAEMNEGTSDRRYDKMLCVMEAKKSEPKSATKRTSGNTSGGSSGGGSSSAQPNKRQKLADHRPILVDAQSQLVRYSRQMYKHQHNRVFSWGLTVCGSLLQVHLLGPDCILSSGDLDMTEADDRRKFIRWLVDMCLAEDVRRGFAPSLQFESTPFDHWETTAMILNGEGVLENTTVYLKAPTCVAGSTFGRHTRGFPASTRIENIGPGGNPDMFFKLAFQYVDRDVKLRHKTEIDHLRAINAKYKSGGRPGVRVPELVDGTTAKAMNVSGAMVDFTTDFIYGEPIARRYRASDQLPSENAEPRKQPQSRIAYRELNCLLMKPCYDTLSSVRSVDELIVVIADVMRTHDWLLTECDLIHRDISPNNILIQRCDEADGGYSIPYGQLNDYDYAINPSEERNLRPERTGTLPFMSVHNLESSLDQRTELDDWESIICVLCWLATFGINDGDAKKLKKLHSSLAKHRKLMVKEWVDSASVEVIAFEKRSVFDTQ